jgi:hypothetical protein
VSAPLRWRLEEQEVQEQEVEVQVFEEQVLEEQEPFTQLLLIDRHSACFPGD